MFNWFRRQIGNKQEQTETQSETQETQSQESPESEVTTEEAIKEESTQIDYLNWAKSAYKNIQERQGQSIVETETEAETEIEAVEETGIVEPVETVAVATEIEEEVIESETTTTETNAENKPETASETIAETSLETTVEETEIAFDDEFIWSAQVLASQGKKAEEVSPEEINWLKRLRKGLDKTRRGIVNQLKAAVGQGPLNEAAVTEIESLLLQADLGMDATEYILESLQKKLKEESLPSAEAIAYLKEILRGILDKPLESQTSKNFAPSRDNFNIWLLTGVNGAGKTTTIGKLANLAKRSGYNCTIAAADTFRAAAVQQVKVWGERTGTLVIANPGQNTDPASVVYDAIAASQSRDTQLLLVDTAGRLQNKKNLMEELAKIRRVIDKKAPDAKVESLLVIDSSLGQNGLRQAQVFSEAAKLSGVVLTKLDGSAKGGIAIAIARQLNLPIRFIGVGEGIEDLRPFSSYEFVEALLSS